MIHISKAITSGKAATYFSEHFSNDKSSYYSNKGATQGYWEGKFAAQLGLTGAVQEDHFIRLVNGQDPSAGKQLVHPRIKKDETGKVVRSSHRGGWDLTLNDSKSMSLTMLVGGDTELMAASRMAFRKALQVGEQYAQARGGGNHPGITTGRWAVAMFEHDTARPEEIELQTGEQVLYPSPHHHIHAFLMNMTQAPGDQVRSLQPYELFHAQSLIKAVYQSEMKHAARALGYQVEEGKNGAGEIVGYTEEYLQAESLRSARIYKRLQELGLNGRRAAEIVAHQDRNKKLDLSKEEVRALHQARAEEFGNQPQRIVEQARQKRKDYRIETSVSAQEAVTFAKQKLSERKAVFDDFELVREALYYGQGNVLYEAIRANIEQRKQGEHPEFIRVLHIREDAPGERYTTPEMIALERGVLEYTRQGREQVKAILPHATAESVQREYRHLNRNLGPNQEQAEAAALLLSSRDKVTGLQGGAGTGKTSSVLRIVKENAEAAGFEVLGLAPTGKARDELEAAGLKAQTLQSFLANQDGKRAEKARERLRFLERKSPLKASEYRAKLAAKGIEYAESRKPRLYLVDESSLISTHGYHEFLKHLHASKRTQDRVIEIGDTQQHESVEAGRIFEQQQFAGMRTAVLTKSVRQVPDDLRAVVNKIQKPWRAIGMMEKNGWVKIETNYQKRLDLIAEDYARNPTKTLVVSPDNASRKDINERIRQKLRERGILRQCELRATIYVQRQDLTKADARVAASYRVGNIVQFRTGSKGLGIASGEAVTVVRKDSAANKLTVKRADDVYVTYSPKKHHNVQIMEQQQRGFSEGDRLLFKAPWQKRGIANGQAAAIKSMDRHGNIEAVLEGKHQRTIRWNAKDFHHLDYGYAATSYSSQGATVDRVIVHMDTASKSARLLLSKALAYVALTRPRYEATIYTDDVEKLKTMVQNNKVKETALSQYETEQYGRGVEYKPVQQEKRRPKGYGIAV